MVQVFGTSDVQFDRVRETLGRLIGSGSDVGASVAVTIAGEPVVDIWAGHTDASRNTPWVADTITNVWSMTKTVTALCALLLVDRGQLDPDSPVADYWPEFAQAGKQGVRIRHLLSHTSGVSGWNKPIDISDVYDWDSSVARLASQEPWWEPGTASGYHALTYGHLIGEVVRRITAQGLPEFLQTELAQPLGADFHIGVPEDALDRVSDNLLFPPQEPPATAPDPTSVAFRTATGPVPLVEASWTKEWKQANIGAANGHGNARSIARLQSLISNAGSLDGTTYLAPSTIELILREQSNGADLVIGSHVRWGLGYCLEYAQLPWLPTGRIAFWGGRGGSMVINDLDRQVTVAFVQNQLAANSIGSPSSEAIVSAVYAAL
jgi:CubicO group peptidase (beta-lactamase class C family)